MSEFKDFDAARRERARGRQPIRFRLGGEDFETLAVVPGGAVLDLIAGQRLDHASSCRRFLSVCLRDDDTTDDSESSFARMTSLLYRREDPVDADSVIEIIEWLSGVYAGRPTEPSNDAANGSQPDGRSSKEQLLRVIEQEREASTG